MTTKKDIFTIIKPQKIAFCGIAVILTTIYTLPAQSAMVSRSQAAKQAQPEPEIIVENKASQFDDILDDVTAGGDASRSALAEQIRAQRAALDAADAATAAKQNTNKAMSGGKNSCDQKLRACMKSKCGNDFTKCAGDGDTIWGDKMDACRRDATCTGEEYRLFATEIKADRDMNATIASYNAIVDCGNNYNQCILQECGTTFGKCLGKQAGDNAISKCNKIAKSCQEQDSGLSSRVMTVFGTLRQDAEAQVAKDEERLHTLRDKMRETCKRLGAMFDERTLDCVYTINFYAAQNEKPYASKKAYAGSSFDCDQNWFGIDITTFKENAFRLTRAQTAASSAMLGGGVGMAVGAVTSGAIDRSIERQKAEKEAKQKCTAKGGKWKKGECVENDGKPTRAECRKSGGKWKNGECVENDDETADTGKADDKKTTDEGNANDKKTAKEEEKRKKSNCQTSKGKWKKGKCECPDGTTLDNGGYCITQKDADTKSGDNADPETEAERICRESYGTGLDSNGNCMCPANLGLKTEGTKCVQTEEAKQAQEKCENGGGTWEGGNCIEDDTPKIAQKISVPKPTVDDTPKLAKTTSPLLQIKNRKACQNAGGTWVAKSKQCQEKSQTGDSKKKKIVSDASAAENNEAQTASKPEEIVSDASDAGNNETKTVSEPAKPTSVKPAVTITKDNIESDAQDESWTGFLEEWRCNKGIDECENEYPRLNPEYALWDKDKNIAIRVPRAIYTIINDFEKACKQVNGEMATHYTYTPLMDAPRPWRKVDEGSVICYTTETNNSFNNIQIAPKIGYIDYTSESEALALGLGDRASYTISFEPGLSPFIIDQPERNPFE